MMCPKTETTLKLGWLRIMRLQTSFSMQNKVCYQNKIASNDFQRFNWWEFRSIPSISVLFMIIINSE